ncbi:MAG TPA: TonB family protein [Methylotenera sp.]|nr:TonB family protein [Methylotenera sp.]
MTSQTSTVIDIFTQKNVATDAVYAAILPTKKRDLNGLPLQVAVLASHPAEKKSFTWLTIALVLLAHALVVYLLNMQTPVEKVQTNQAKPMMVSIIAPPSPEPEIVPIIEPPKPEPKPIVKPKKVVEKIVPIEVPVERMVEATTEPPKEEPVTQAEAAPVIAAEPAKAPAKAEPVVEDKIEPPKYGVAYLNNPTPDYPPISVRKGEEGRVLMRVLVSANGAAEDVQIEQSSGFDRLDNVAVAAVKKWRFIPAKKNNQPLSAYVLVPMPFIIEK